MIRIYRENLENGNHILELGPIRLWWNLSPRYRTLGPSIGIHLSAWVPSRTLTLAGKVMLGEEYPNSARAAAGLYAKSKPEKM